MLCKIPLKVIQDGHYCCYQNTSSDRVSLQSKTVRKM